MLLVYYQAFAGSDGLSHRNPVSGECFQGIPGGLDDRRNYPHDSIYMLQNLFNNWFTKLDMQKMTAGAVMLAAVLGIFLILCQKAEERWKQ